MLSGKRYGKMSYTKRVLCDVWAITGRCAAETSTKKHPVNVRVIWDVTHAEVSTSTTQDRADEQIVGCSCGEHISLDDAIETMMKIVREAQNGLPTQISGSGMDEASLALNLSGSSADARQDPPGGDVVNADTAL